MSRNANHEPLGSNRKVFGGGNAQQPPLQQSNFVGKFFKNVVLKNRSFWKI